MPIRSLTPVRLRKSGLGAFFRPRDIEPLGVSFPDLQRLVVEGVVEKVGPGLMIVLANFFNLDANGPLRNFADGDEFLDHFQHATSLMNAKVPPGTQIARERFKNRTFDNVALSHVTFRETTFTNCCFRDCLFIGTEFDDCEFHSCRFENCNTYKFRLRKVYIEPSSFHLAAEYRSTASNIGVELFQKLYDNAMDFRSIPLRGSCRYRAQTVAQISMVVRLQPAKCTSYDTLENFQKLGIRRNRKIRIWASSLHKP